MQEHFIPLGRQELVCWLCDDPHLAGPDREQFQHLARSLTATCHYEYNQLLERCKAAYAPFDPDADTKSLQKQRPEELQEKLVALLANFAWFMERANYKHLTRQDLEPALDSCSQFGLQMDVDFRIFERLAIFARGSTVESRPLRRLRRLYRQEKVDVPIYQRLVMIMKLRKHKRLSRLIDTSKIYLQVFKNIPQLDINMLLPGARVRMTQFDRGRVGFPMLSGLAMALYNIAGDFGTVMLRTVANPSLLLWALATGAFTYGTKTYFSYLATRQRYNLNLTQVLYFQNLDTNLGVLGRILDEAQEQECREVLLAYYFLWRHAGGEGWTATQLQEAIAKDFQERAELPVNLEVHDALAKLERLSLVERDQDRYRALPIAQALAVLQASWSNYLDPRDVDRWTLIRQQKLQTIDFTI